MISWSPEDAIAMERRHALDGEQRVVRQEVLLGKLIHRGSREAVLLASEVLDTMRVSLEMSRTRIQELEVVRMTDYAVSTKTDSAKNNNPDLIQPMEPQRDLLG